MAPPPSNAPISPIIALVVRILTFICVLISVIVLTTNTLTASTDYGDDVKIKFKDFYAYRYLFATTLIALVYTLLQTALTVLQVATGNRIGGDLRLQLDFFGDKIISIALVSGAAASFGMTQDLRTILEVGDNSDITKFLNVANAAASMCLIGFFFCATSSVFSAYALPKRV